MTGPVIRPMTTADVQGALDMRGRTRENAVSIDELAAEYGVTPASAVAALQSTQSGWVCEDRGRIAGFAIGDRANGEVVVVALLPEYERRGIGRLLLTHVQNMLFSAGHDTIWLWANPDPEVRTTGFYRHMGWVNTGHIENGAVRLERSALRGE